MISLSVTELRELAYDLNDFLSDRKSSIAGASDHHQIDAETNDGTDEDMDENGMGDLDKQKPSLENAHTATSTQTQTAIR
jgi:hypothetical protein